MGFIEIISAVESERWDTIVRSFMDYDVYYLSGYIKAYQLHGDGEPQLYHYSSDELNGICVVLKRDISTCSIFRNTLPELTYYDIITPYGYGGFLLEGNINTGNLHDFQVTYNDFLQKENIVSEFVRFHPLLDNANKLRDISTVIDLGNTINIDLKDREKMWRDISREHRNRIRKAEKCGVEIFHGKNWSLFEEFIRIYNATMEDNHADSYYFFDKEFYASIHNDLNDNYEMFYAVYREKIISMSIIIYANNRMYYHFSGSDMHYRHLSPSTLLLYKAACWGNSQGFHTFNLGGGLGSSEDSLYQFKKKFNKNSDCRFSIGKNIVDPEIYSCLTRKCTEINHSFDLDSTFFPLYRQ